MLNINTCYSAAVKVVQLFDEHKDFRVFASKLRDLIQETLACEGVAIFLQSTDRTKLELVATTGTSWTVPVNQQVYKRGESFTGAVWVRNEPLLMTSNPSDWNRNEKSIESAPTGDSYFYIWMPLSHNRNETVGVIRCRNKQQQQQPKSIDPFTEDDKAVLQAICNVATPLILSLLEREQRKRALSKLAHELKVPIVAIRGAAEFMIHNSQISGLHDNDYLSEIWSWTDLLRRLLGNMDVFSNPVYPVSIQAKPTLLLSDVIAPASRQVNILLAERGLSSKSIHYEGWKDFPPLWIDPNQIQQVVFNILSNAIKYCSSNRASFRVEISGTKTKEYYILRFRDWGIGITSDMREAVFQEGVRSPAAVEMNITGQGLGLWVVRMIIEAHDGKVELTNLFEPTEFTIYLPAYLELHPPDAWKQRTQQEMGKENDK